MYILLFILILFIIIMIARYYYIQYTTYNQYVSPDGDVYVNFV